MSTAAAPGSAQAGTLVLVGCGQMGSAMLRGWLAGGAAERFHVIEPAGAPAALAGAAGVEFHRSADDLPSAPAPDAVVFAVKPQLIDEVLPAYRRWARPGTLFVSIAAGTTIAGIARHLGEAASAGQRRLCDALLAAIGDSTWVEDEALMDAVTAVSGSGPAYVFLLIEALAEAGVRSGLPGDLALNLARATVAGAGELARLSPETPARLRENVTSPGGTTRAALDVLMAPNGLPELLERAVAAATARSRQLAS